MPFKQLSLRVILEQFCVDQVSIITVKMYLHSFFIKWVAFFVTNRGKSTLSMPRSIKLYVRIGSGRLNGGLKEKGREIKGTSYTPENTIT